MEKIQKLLEEHNEEFTEMVNNFYDEKYPSKKVKLYAHLKLWGNITTVTYSQKITGRSYQT